MTKFGDSDSVLLLPRAIDNMENNLFQPQHSDKTKIHALRTLFTGSTLSLVVAAYNEHAAQHAIDNSLAKRFIQEMFDFRDRAVLKQPRLQ